MEFRLHSRLDLVTVGSGLRFDVHASSRWVKPPVLLLLRSASESSCSSSTLLIGGARFSSSSDLLRILSPRYHSPSCQIPNVGVKLHLIFRSDRQDYVIKGPAHHWQPQLQMQRPSGTRLIGSRIHVISSVVSTSPFSGCSFNRQTPARPHSPLPQTALPPTTP